MTIRLRSPAFALEGASLMTSESTVPKELHETLPVGALLTGSTDVERLAEFGPRSFLVGPGGQDYVGDNSYDNKKGSE
jgi:hypothetical protein